jgi:AcrR family transcriptional regulator
MLPLSTSILLLNVDCVNIYRYAQWKMAQSAARPRRKPRHRYHHGDLRRALLDEALRTIQHDGVDALTLRTIGLRLGVSRTALYRHFADKRALLSGVATEGFRMLRERLVEAWAPGGVRGFDATGVAYIRFAMANPSHYRVMFGGFVDDAPRDEGLTREATAAFQTLVDSIVMLQKEGAVRKDDPLQLARFIWAAVHGISMLIIDGQLPHQQSQIDDLIQFAVEHIHTGIARRPH